MLTRRLAKPCKLCTHVMPSGKFCRSPAIRRQYYCCFHKELHKREQRAAMARLRVLLDEEDRQERFPGDDLTWKPPTIKNLIDKPLGQKFLHGKVV